MFSRHIKERHFQTGGQKCSVFGSETWEGVVKIIIEAYETGVRRQHRTDAEKHWRLKRFRQSIGMSNHHQTCNFVMVLVKNKTGDILTAFPTNSEYVERST
jgi:hypothetical protein